jgi:hypothetical protein
MATSPTQLTLKKLKSEGFTTVQIVERWNAFAKVRQDLFQIIDVLAIKDGETIGIQVTSKSNISARIKKIANSEHINNIRDANWKILVHGWYKEKNKWKVEERDVS